MVLYNLDEDGNDPNPEGSDLESQGDSDPVTEGNVGMCPLPNAVTFLKTCILRVMSYPPE